MLAEMDSPSGKEGFETLSWIAKDAGTYRFKVNRLDEEGNAESGKYSITLTAQNSATEANRQRLKAEHLFLQTVKLPVVGIQEIPVRLDQYETLLAVWQELKDEQMVSLIESIMARLRELQT